MIDYVIEQLETHLADDALVEYDTSADAILVDNRVVWPEARKGIAGNGLTRDQAVGLLLDALHEIDPVRYPAETEPVLHRAGITEDR